MPTQKVLTVAGQEILELDITLGQVIQAVSGTIPAATSGTTQIPFDNTSPLITEGFSILSFNVTPKVATSKQHLSLNLNIDHSNSNRTVTATVWVGNALVYTHAVNVATAGRPVSLPLQTWFNSLNTAPQTVQVRVGANGNGTTYVGSSPAATLGGSRFSVYNLLEVLSV